MTPNKKYNISLVVEVDSDANFLEIGNGDNEDVILEVITDLIYDTDDITCLEADCEVI